MLGALSRRLNRMLGGHDHQSLCARMAFEWGSECLFCRWIGGVLRDPDHCADDLRNWLNR